MARISRMPDIRKKNKRGGADRTMLGSAQRVGSGRTGLTTQRRKALDKALRQYVVNKNAPKGRVRSWPGNIPQ